MDFAGYRCFVPGGNTDLKELPGGSYERVAALTQSYRQRLAQAGSSVVIDHPLKREERVNLFLTEEAEQRYSIERGEQNDAWTISRRWSKQSSLFGRELHAIKEARQKKEQLMKQRALLEEQIYREQFLYFWRKQKQQHHHKRYSYPSDVVKLISYAYKHNVLPFATDPIECWERGILVPPELQQAVEVSDDRGTILLPPLHELSMSLREAYNKHRAQERGVALAKKIAMLEK
ncbi:hypothetical protein DQ04_01181070 [Trypanosoma grayi]|uniref:hypothetical protein n=1 Tax=Trypanosoma grayi TaxID=71804 RepID=UPI0004F4671A|nr:hypothetical protein DQ04_01181070 [Trypanosoma grayi]KEG13153.1 hypothetical protein DQ04_01181070 [Trypanosoma grayi]